MKEKISVKIEKTKQLKKPKKEASALEGCSYEMMSAYTMVDTEEDNYSVADTAEYLADVSRMRLIQKIFNETNSSGNPIK